MKLVVNKDAKEYIQKCKGECLIVDMILDETNPGCGCGQTKKYYTPYIRIGQNKENLYKDHILFKDGDIDVFISKKATSNLSTDDTVTIYLEKAFFMKKLSISGLTVSIT